MKKLAILSVMAISVMITACGNNGNNGNNGNHAASGGSSSPSNSATNSGGDSEPLKVSIMTNFHGATPPSKDGPVQQAIEKATNTKLDIQWNSATNYIDKLNVSLASGDLADLVLIPDQIPMTNNVFMQAARSGAFWDLAPFIDDYPNLKNKIPAIAWETTKVGGANYFIPRPRPSESDWYFVFRKDWLDKLGLQVPTTDQELYDVMKAFTEKDPDGDGKKDTTGFTGIMWTGSFGDFKSFEGIFTGVNGDWKDNNGSLEYYAFLPEERKAIEYLAKAYSEGLIEPDFASLTNDQSHTVFTSGKAGIKIDASAYNQTYVDVISKNVPGFNVMDLVPATNINGYNPKAIGFNGGNAIPKTVPEDKMKKILAMYDRWMDDDVIKYQHEGIEGVHHTVENGKVVLNTEKITQDGLPEYDQIVYVADPYSNAYKDSYSDEAKQAFKAIQDERAKTSVAPVAVGIVSETGKSYLPELQTQLNDLKVKIILGHQPIKAWDDFVEKTKNDPKMQQVIKEMNEAYQSGKQ